MTSKENTVIENKRIEGDFYCKVIPLIDDVKTELKGGSLTHHINPPIPNLGYSTVEVVLDFTAKDTDNKVVLHLKAIRLFEFLNLTYNAEGVAVIKEVINETMINLYEKIYKEEINRGYLLNPIGSFFTSKIGEVLSDETDISYVFSLLHHGT